MAKSISPTCETLLDKHRERGIPSPATVVIPLYNYSQFIVEALESVRLQTLDPLDLIVVDDCSTDNSADLARDWLNAHAARFRRARLLRHARNAGLAVTRNAGFRQATTPFVFPLDADNILYPTCLEKLSRSLSQSEAAFAYCLVEQFGSDPKAWDHPIMHLQPWNPSALAKENPIDAMVLLRKRTWEQAGGYSEDMPRPGWEDYDLWFKIARVGGYGLQVFQILARYRVHPASMLRTVTNREDSQRELRAYFQRVYPQFSHANSS